MRLFIITLLSLSLASPLFAFGKKPPKNILTFHIQAHSTDNPKMIFPLPVGGKRLFFQKSPITFTKEIAAFLPFFAEDGTAGATFQFNKAAAQRIAAITTQNRQKWIVAMLNGRPMDAVYVEKPVTDGRLVVWQGMKQGEVVAFDYIIPHIGETSKQWKQRLKDHKAARAAEIKARKEKKK
ncbi:hypothetical protein N9230_01360 [Akkermansiaceae bacterium]|nr:hypothetical protein [Akkermansiaceae bacterium]